MHLSARLALLFLLLSSGTLRAQQVVLPAGGEATGSGGTVSWSVGQVAYTTNGSSGGTLTQGVQQPYEVIATSLVQHPDGGLMATAFPNPTSSLITVHVNGQVEKGRYSLVDGLGQVVLAKKLTGSETFIEMDGLANGAYTLQLTADDKPIGTFRILKH